MGRNRRRFEQIQSAEERLVDQAAELRERAQAMPPGVEKDALLRRARQAEAGTHVTKGRRGCSCRRRWSPAERKNAARAFSHLRKRNQ